MSKKSNPPHEGGMDQVAAPCCGHLIDSANEVEAIAGKIPGGAYPNKGDLSICINCGTILVFEDPETNLLRVAGPKDLVGISSDTLHNMARAKKAIETLKKQRRNK